MKQYLNHSTGTFPGAKLFTVAIAIVALALVFSSCKKDPEPATSFHLNLSTALVQSPATAGTSSMVNVTANASWKITMSSQVDWISLDKTTGDGNGNFLITITRANQTGAKRTVTLNVELLNGQAPVKQVTIEQDFTVVNPVTIEWKKLLGGNGNDYGYSILKTTDGGYLFSGRTTSNNSGDVAATKGGIDMWVVKLDAAGSIAWHKTYGGSSDEYSVASTNTPDGGYVLTGYTVSSNTGDVGQNHGATDFWVIKIDANGGIVWKKVLGGNADDRPNAITTTTDGRIAVAGYTASNNNGDVGVNHEQDDFWVVVLDQINGDVLWKKTYGGNGSDIARAIIPAPGGGLYVGGSTNTNNNGDVSASKGATDMWIIKLDNAGTISWKKNYGGSNMEELYALAAGPNNTLIAAGTTKSNNNGDVGTTRGGEDIWVLQLNAPDGNLQWQKSLGGNNMDVAKGLVVRNNGSIVVAGYSYSDNNGDVDVAHGAGDFWVVQLSATGSIGWKKLLGGDDEDLAQAIVDSGDGVVVAGQTRSNNNGDVGPARGNSDAWVVKLKE